MKTLAANPNMTKAALAELRREPTFSLMTRRRASVPAQPTSEPAHTVSVSRTSQPNQRSKSGGSAVESEKVNGDSNAAKPAGRGGVAKSGGSTLAIHHNHPEELCRYPNKRCFNKRALKNNGELHKFCDTHRDSANRYQRKLEQRLKEKRIQSRMRALEVQQAQTLAQVQAQAQMTHAQAHGFGVADPAFIGTSDTMVVSPYPGVERLGEAVPHVASRAPSPVTSTMVPQVPFPEYQAIGLLGSSGNTPSGIWTQEYEPFQHPVPLQSEDLDCLDLLFEK